MPELRQSRELESFVNIASWGNVWELLLLGVSPSLHTMKMSFSFYQLGVGPYSVQHRYFCDVFKQCHLGGYVKQS